MSDFFRVQLGVVARAEGHCAAKRSAYQSCGVVIAHDGERFDFSRKAAEHVATLMLAPQGAPDWAHQPESLWQRAAAAEKRADAQEARILDFSIPRAVPAELWESCVRHVYEPFIRMGMAMQVDVHDSPASDGGRNINVHGLATLREIHGDGFATKKNRAWNDAFRERNGRVVREQFAECLTAFCRQHNIHYEGDARSNAERDWPAPEPELPKWNFEVLARTGEMPEALAALQDHRKRRREWEAAHAEAIEAALD
ncbi:MAG TPA: MobA/MobL family protein, partial [Tianweitania sediminis]|nr:MobA/MobL family protein [Tianweitania sediminis]